jgi:RimJ/RimL family protein N-acetyltransferase
MVLDWQSSALLAPGRSVKKSGRMRSIVTDRLILRPWEEGDADFLFDLESRWETVRYLGADPTSMRSKSEAVASIQRRRALDHPVHGIWAIVLRDSNALAGNLLLKPAHLSAGSSGEHPVEIGWHLHPSAQSLGFATEAAAGALADAASRGLASVLAVTDPRNSASHRVCRRLGFTEEGITSRFYDSPQLVFSRVLSAETPATPASHSVR